MKYNNDSLKSVLSYDKISGLFHWSKTMSRRCKKGSVAGWTSYAGYNEIRVGDLIYKAHRLAVAFSFNEEPIGEVDHIDGDRLNNSLLNLRMVTRQENQRNSTIRTDNQSGFCGVYWDKDREKWRAGIRVDNKTIYLGIFNKKDDAIKARKEANLKYGFHANHGKEAHKD